MPKESESNMFIQTKTDEKWPCDDIEQFHGHGWMIEIQSIIFKDMNLIHSIEWERNQEKKISNDIRETVWIEYYVMKKHLPI